MRSQAENPTLSRAAATGPAPSVWVPRLFGIGGILGALASISCCIAPLALFALGISGAWIANLTGLAPYQPYFIAGTVVCLGSGYWLVFRSKAACAGGEVCARPLQSRIVTASLVLATVLVTAAAAFDFLAPLFLPS